jgi:cytoskeletal protein CcmA (bactofilin family)
MKKNKKLFDTIQTWIGTETVFTGDLSSLGSIRIDGKLIGNIKDAESVIIGENAEIKGNINTKYIVVSGTVNGNIVASEAIELLNKSKVIGDLSTNILSINEGALFKGKSIMSSDTAEQENNEDNHNI